MKEKDRERVEERDRHAQQQYTFHCAVLFSKRYCISHFFTVHLMELLDLNPKVLRKMLVYIYLQTFFENRALYIYTHQLMAAIFVSVSNLTYVFYKFNAHA